MSSSRLSGTVTKWLVIPSSDWHSTWNWPGAWGSTWTSQVIPGVSERSGPRLECVGEMPTWPRRMQKRTQGQRLPSRKLCSETGPVVPDVRGFHPRFAAQVCRLRLSHPVGSLLPMPTDTARRATELLQQLTGQPAATFRSGQLEAIETLVERRGRVL